MVIKIGLKITFSNGPYCHSSDICFRVGFNYLKAPENGTKVDIYWKLQHLVHLSWLSDDEMVVVEVNPLTLIERLPPAFVQNTFGRK
ncbi:hypothetical protein NQ317_013158 [Molorchus minor]|uniref:Uncharacterized protein n=1 Tax=Molorchus minor TaxID=1323400 RepID=A0ABQ9JWG8_9CUCU|nr:hypothetical protein NQ317_013158 [Molorchus minor]